MNRDQFVGFLKKNGFDRNTESLFGGYINTLRFANTSDKTGVYIRSGESKIFDSTQYLVSCDLTVERLPFVSLMCPVLNFRKFVSEQEAKEGGEKCIVIEEALALYDPRGEKECLTASEASKQLRLYFTHLSNYYTRYEVMLRAAAYDIYNLLATPNYSSWGLTKDIFSGANGVKKYDPDDVNTYPVVIRLDTTNPVVLALKKKSVGALYTGLEIKQPGNLLDDGTWLLRQTISPSSPYPIEEEGTYILPDPAGDFRNKWNYLSKYLIISCEGGRYEDAVATEYEINKFVMEYLKDLHALLTKQAEHVSMRVLKCKGLVAKLAYD